MRKLTSFAATTAAALVFSTVGSAQTGAIDYDFNWAPMSNTAQIGLPGAFIFGTALFGTPHAPGVGDAIRRCYSVDITQGGRNENGMYETTWFTVMQGWGANNAVPGNDIGLISIQSATDSDLGGDACLSPWFSSVGNTGGHSVSVAAVIGLQAGTAGNPFPGVWQSVFQWAAGTSTTFTGVAGNNVIGVDANGLPLLANVIYEVQGPLNSGLNNLQYYLGTTDERTGAGTVSATPGRGAGGVTNGNSNWGASLYATTADLSGAASHTRIFGNDGTNLTAAPAFWGTTPISGEANNFVAFSTPFLWAENNGSIGAGGADWNIGSGTPSTVNVWLKDIKSGAEGTGNVLYKTGGAGAAGAAFDPNLLVQFAYFLWSGTPAISMQQLPMSWDDLLGSFTPQAGSYLISTPTSREGVQRLPIVKDALTDLIFGITGLSQGTAFTGADSPFYDAGVADSALWEGAFDPVESGLSKLTIAGGAAFPLVPTIDPTLAGINLGVAGVSIQVRTDAVLGLKIDIAEVSNGLTITLQ